MRETATNIERIPSESLFKNVVEGLREKKGGVRRRCGKAGWVRRGCWSVPAWWVHSPPKGHHRLKQAPASQGGRRNLAGQVFGMKGPEDGVVLQPKVLALWAPGFGYYGIECQRAGRQGNLVSSPSFPPAPAPDIPAILSRQSRLARRCGQDPNPRLQ